MADANAQIEKAKDMIRAKKYEDAQALLLTIDHPTADKLLERLEKVLPAKTSPQAKPIARPENQPSFTGKLVVTIVLLFCLVIPGIFALTIFSKEAKLYPNAPGAGGLIMLNKHLFWIIVLALVFLAIAVLLPVFNAYMRLPK